MRSANGDCLIVGVLFLVLTNVAFAQAEPVTPIRYAVEENNRLFVDDDSKRYAEDLHLYLHCVARKVGSYIADGPVCNDYRQRAHASSIEVPDLRTGPVDKEYRVRYDKVLLAHPPGYAVDGRRRVRFYLSEAWWQSNSPQVTGCHWTFTTTGGQIDVLSANCTPVVQEADLLLSNDGKELSWQAEVRLTVQLASGSSLVLETKATVHDFLIVAMGDSFTSGEGNPERNQSRGMPAQWLDYRCHRSVFSYPVMVATQLALADPRHSVTLVDVACSGARTTEGVLQGYDGIISNGQAYRLWHRRWLAGRKSPLVPEHWKRYGTEVPTLPSQIDQVSELLDQQGGGARRKPDLVLMSIGVNDVGFSDLLYRLATKRCGAKCFAELRRWRAEEAADCADNSRKARVRQSLQCLEQRLAKVRETIVRTIAPQRAYLMEYIDPLHDEHNLLCTSKPQHKKRLLTGVLGPLQGLVGRVWPIELTEDEFRFADADLYMPLAKALGRTAAAPDWAVPSSLNVHEQWKRGFCAKPSWYHNYQESKAREGTNPGKPFESTGTLHPNGFGHFYAALRVLTQLRSEHHLAGHNINLMDDSDFDPKARGIVRPDKGEGFAFYLQNMHETSDRIDKYYKF